ncbi:MAG TPA: 3-phosphoshikimate 1-carboxyvinyltransferase [Tepidisphaeraceae bacterium]|nr:3-phosphoshikimate 1-carboxyvinyltransferase [Tepidisphaeraceae bacterium]
MSDLRIEPVSAPFTATITPPGSKSLTNRALVLAALARGECVLSNVLFADDTKVMLDALRALGFQIDIDEENKAVRAIGQGGRIPASTADIFCGNSGTTIRFLAAMLSIGKGTYTLDGVPRMRQRPIGPLVTMLRNLGVRLEHTMTEGYPPIRIDADGLPGGFVRYGSETSSQYLSAVLMAAPYARNEVRVDLAGPQTSWPYVAMTMQLMDIFGVTPELVRDPATGRPKQIIVPPGVYTSTHYAIEPDASNATYFLAAAAVHPEAKVTVEGLGKQSLQGDVAFADLLHQMGADLVFGRDFITVKGTDRFEATDVDLSNMPDTAQTLAVACVFAEGTSTLRGLHTLRVKETDRLAALATELKKLGADVDIEGDDALIITPPENGKIRPATIATYDDHRMAMSFAIAGTKSAGVTIQDVECVNKTYPQFFTDLDRSIRPTT